VNVYFVELHARSAFSFLEGSSLPEDLAARCAQLDQPAMAITDAHGVYGAPRFHLAAKKLGPRALIGAEVNASFLKDPYRFTLLAENRSGYQNLCRLITHAKLREGKPGKPEYPFATDDEFASHSEGLICLTGGDEGPLASVYRQGSGPAIEGQARQMLERLTFIFGRGNVFVELQRHYRRDQEARNQSLVQLARSLGLPLLATNGVAYATEDRRNLQDVLTCVHHKTTLNEAGKLLNFNSERHLQTSQTPLPIPRSLPAASSSLLRTSAMSFRAIRSRPAKLRCLIYGSLPSKARAGAINPIMKKLSGRLNANSP
jgi:error-prone DNA polymerase